MNKKALKELIKAMNLASDLDEALRVGALAILDQDEPSKTEPKQAAAKPKAPAKKRKPFDIGKAIACYKAGWSIAKIADELRTTDVTVRKYLRQAGYLKPKGGTNEQS